MTTNTLLFSEKYCEINLDESSNILYAKWVGFLTIDQIKKGCDFMSAYIKDNVTTQHLSDHQDLKVLTPDCKDYLTGEWFPEVEKLGLKKVAALVSTNIFARSSIDDVNSRALVQLGDLTIDTFNEEADCIKWLQS